MATAKELQAFLLKRGYDTTVEKDNDTYIVGIRSQTVEDVAKLLASIDEPGRYVISVQFSDILDLLMNSTRTEIANFSGSLATIRESMDNGYEKLSQADGRLREQGMLSTHGITELIKALTDRVAELEKPKHWWNRGK